jgi:hypothetical protein
MTFEESIREAAHRAQEAVMGTLDQYSRGSITEEEDFTGSLAGQLEARLRGQIGGLTWDTTILRRRRGVAAEEQRVGADMIIHVKMEGGNSAADQRVELLAEQAANSTLRVTGPRIDFSLNSSVAPSATRASRAPR